MPIIGRAHAHSLVRDGGIAGVLHIEPGDQPVAGAPEPLYIEISDRAGAFSAAGCDCVLAVRRGGTEISRQPLPAVESATLRGTVTLPEQGAYALVLTGKAVDGAHSFTPFTLEYAVRAEPASGAPLPLLPLAATIGSVAVITALYAFFSLVRRR